MAVWCLEQTGQVNLPAGRQDLLSDDGPVDLYEAGLIHRTSVCHLVRRAKRDGPAQG
jgi:hypothetical protein